MSSVSAWLDEVVSGAGMTAAQHCANYWICRARLQEKANSSATDVIDIYEEAIRHQVKVSCDTFTTIC